MNEIKNICLTHKKFFIGLGIVLILALISVLYLLNKVNRLENSKINSQTGVESLMKDVSSVIILPPHEVPTIATVSDPAKLKDQAFFSKAEAGDIVLIYSSSKKAILWRPSTKQIVEMSALNSSSTIQAN